MPETDKIIMSEEESENAISTETLIKEMKRLQEEVKKQSMTNQTSFSYIAKERKGKEGHFLEKTLQWRSMIGSQIVGWL